MADGTAEREPGAARPHMPGYGILPPEEGRGLLSWSWASERVAAARRYWVSTARADGRPHLMPVWGLWLDGVLYFSTGGESVKARNLDRDARCSIGIEHADVDLVIEGVVARLSDRPTLARVAERYSEKYGFPTDPDEYEFFALRPRRAFAFIEHPDEFAGTATRWTFGDDDVAG